jgi:hypothetical protein
VKVDLKKWWMIFGVLMFLFITLSFVSELFAYIEVFVYFVGCGLVAVSFFKVIIDNVFHDKAQRRMKNSLSKKNHKSAKSLKVSLPLQHVDNLEKEVNAK